MDVGRSLRRVCWLIGWPLWGQDLGPEYRVGFDAFTPELILGLGAPGFLIAGLLRQSGRVAVCRIGTGIAVLAAIFVGYIASFSFFGGFCLDPGDVCITSWPSRFTALGTALFTVALGAGSEILRPRLR